MKISTSNRNKQSFVFIKVFIYTILLLFNCICLNLANNAFVNIEISNFPIKKDYSYFPINHSTTLHTNYVYLPKFESLK